MMFSDKFNDKIKNRKVSNKNVPRGKEKDALFCKKYSFEELLSNRPWIVSVYLMNNGLFAENLGE